MFFQRAPPQFGGEHWKKQDSGYLDGYHPEYPPQPELGVGTLTIAWPTSLPPKPGGRLAGLERTRELDLIGRISAPRTTGPDYPGCSLHAHLKLRRATLNLSRRVEPNGSLNRPRPGGAIGEDEWWDHHNHEGNHLRPRSGVQGRVRPGG
jgi:hypothetical protein